MKHKIREEKKREQRIGLALTVAILIAIISVSSFFIYSMLSSSPQEQETSSTSEPKAAIVDHLSLTAPNQTFIQTATNTLKQAGYTVDYYQGEEVTVEFYRNLPTHGYSLIILRVHSALGRRQEPPVALFTSEPAEKYKYVYERLTDRLHGVAYSPQELERGITYFGIMPSFVRSSLNGRFQNTTIIMMGCNGLTYTDMAEAFLGKGAKVYISWNKPVLASHTDSATAHLLQHFLIQKLTLKESLQETFKEVGFDPVYESLLIYYPLEAGDYTIQNIIGDIRKSKHGTFSRECALFSPIFNLSIFCVCFSCCFR